MAFGAARGFQPTPPDKGSFPLDHHAQCRAPMQEFLECLKQTESHHHLCRNLSKAYLECRMQEGLMAEENLDDLGYKHAVKVNLDKVKEAAQNKKEKKGFFGGVSVVQSSTGSKE